MFEINNNEKSFFTGKVDERGRLRCPMCRGRGYFEPTERGGGERVDNIFPIGEAKGKDTTFKLPALENKGNVRETLKLQKKLTLPSIRSNHCPDKKNVNDVYHSKSNPVVQSTYEERGYGDAIAEDNFGLKQSFVKPDSADSNSNDSDLGNQLLPSPKTPKNPHEFLKLSLLKLKGSDWNDSLSALKDIIQISRYQPGILEGSMTIIYRSIITLLKSFRSKITRTACQVVNELFLNVPNTHRPEFDELISALLQKTADTNKFVRRDANEALDSMVINILPVHSVRTLVQKGIPHRNSTVRAAAIRLLVCVVGLVGVHNIFAGNKETRSRIMYAAAQCLQDGSQEVRSYACRTIKMLMEHEDFDEVLQASVNNVLFNRIEKTLITIKYHK